MCWWWWYAANPCDSYCFAIACQYFRPICLGDEEDLSLNLTERTGVVAGWGATEVSYSDTLCGYIKGVTDPDSGTNVLKKVEGWR